MRKIFDTLFLNANQCRTGSAFLRRCSLFLALILISLSSFVAAGFNPPPVWTGGRLNPATTKPLMLPPVANFDKKTTLEETPVLVNVLSNDTDPDGNLNPASVTVTKLPSDGSAVVNVGGSITYSPFPDFFGSDTLIYRVCDTGTPILCDTALVILTVTGVNDPPVAIFNHAGTPVNMPVVINILANDADTDGNLNPASVTITEGPFNGNATINLMTGAITYTPNLNYTGSDILVYEVCDDGTPLPAKCDTALVTITIGDVNEPPEALPDLANTAEEAPVTMNVLANDSDTDGNLVLSSVTVEDGPFHGSVFVDMGTGEITYIPDPGFAGLDTLVYQVCDDGTPLPPQCDTALVVIFVGDINIPPFANFDRDTTLENAPVTVQILTNDFDIDSNIDPATVTLTSPPTHGMATINFNGSLTYTPNSGYLGPDVLVYQVCDDGTPLPALCDTAIVYLTVRPDCNPLDTTELSAQICEGDTFAFGGQDLTATGVYFHAVPDAVGCDSTLKLTLTVIPLPDAGEDVTLLCNETIAPSEWNFNINGGWQVLNQPAGANAQIDGTGNATNMTLSGTYLFELTQNGCPDEVEVNVPGLPGLCVPVAVVRN